jgi:hypothetical protein
MSKPSWEQQEALDNMEVERELERQGQRESEQMSFNHLRGDFMGLEDGRPGLSWGNNPLGGHFLAMPVTWYLLLRVGGVAVLLGLALLVRYCVAR